jgi:hypothetical protein
MSRKRKVNSLNEFNDTINERTQVFIPDVQIKYGYYQSQEINEDDDEVNISSELNNHEVSENEDDLKL